MCDLASHAAKRPRPSGVAVRLFLNRARRSVYSVCMARVNVYLPDELAERARAAGVSVSAVTQDALRSALAVVDTDHWLDHLEQMPRTEVPHDHVIRALDDARDEFGAGSER